MEEIIQEEKPDGFIVNKEGEVSRGIHFSVSGKLGQHEYWRIGPFATEELAKECIATMLKGGSRKKTKEDDENEDQKQRNPIIEKRQTISQARANPFSRRPRFLRGKANQNCSSPEKEKR